jgi:hypothetical protein
MTKFTSDLLHSILPPPMVFPRGLAADLCSLSPIPNVGEVDGGSFLQGSNFRSVHCQCPQAQPDRARNLYRIALSLGRLPDKIERVNTEATKTRIDASSSTPRVFSLDFPPATSSPCRYELFHLLSPCWAFCRFSDAQGSCQGMVQVLTVQTRYRSFDNAKQPRRAGSRNRPGHC